MFFFTHSQTSSCYWCRIALTPATRPLYLHSAVLYSGYMLVTGGNSHNDTTESSGSQCYSDRIMAYHLCKYLSASDRILNQLKTPNCSAHYEFIKYKKVLPNQWSLFILCELFLAFCWTAYVHRKLVVIKLNNWKKLTLLTSRFSQFFLITLII